MLGLDADGDTARGNRYGIYADTAIGLTVGGTTAAERNVVSANDWGIALYNDSTDAVITGNHVGTDATGLLDRGNRFDGLFIVNSSSRARIGGPTAAEANVVAGNGGDGISIGSGTMADAVVEGNWIGVGADGTTPLANTDAGINLGSGQTTQVHRQRDRARHIGDRDWPTTTRRSSPATTSGPIRPRPRPGPSPGPRC